MVVDPAARAITHLAVDRDCQGQLVPFALVEAVIGGIRLRCTIAEFENLDPAGKTVRQPSGLGDVPDLSRGQIQGHVVDPGSRQVTHVLPREGHVFGRKVMAIPIGAVTGVNENGIQLYVAKQQVKDLPSGWLGSSG